MTSLLSAEARKQVTEAFESALTMWKRTDMPRRLDDALTWVENDHLANARIEAALALLASLPEAPAVEAKPSVDGLMELARQYAHAYFNRYSNENERESDKNMHQKCEARLRAAVETLEGSRIAPEGQAADQSLKAVANRIAGAIPEGFEIQLCLEPGAGWVTLRNEEGDVLPLPDAADKDLCEQLDDALAAIRTYLEGK